MRPSKPLDVLRALGPAEIRAALLARGVGLTEGEVAQVLTQLEESTGARAAGRGRLELDGETGLRAGAPASRPAPAAVDQAIDWLAKSLFVDR